MTDVRIYLDHNATTPVAPEAAAAMTAVLTQEVGNPSSVHAYGQRAKTLIDAARGAVASLIHAEPPEVVFTSGGTESDNLAVRGAADAAWPRRPHLVTSGIEHEAVLNTVRALERRGWRVSVLALNASGVLDVDALRAAITPDTALVSIMLANNEVGTIQPVAELAAVAHEAGALFHTDAVQAVGKIAVDVRELGVDVLSLSAHKFNGPSGVGALWIRRGVRLVPTATGGRQERTRRAGTENMSGIVGCGVAAALAARHLADMDTVRRLRDRLEQEVLRTIPDTAVNGDRTRRVPNTTNISFDGVEAESLLIALDLAGIAVSTGSACSSGTLEPSHVLRAMGLPMSRARNSLRFSLGPSNTEADVDALLGCLPALVTKLRRLGRRAAVAR